MGKVSRAAAGRAAFRTVTQTFKLKKKIMKQKLNIFWEGNRVLPTS